MIFSEILNTYFGWCPRFDSKLTRASPSFISSLSTVGKVVMGTILASWGLWSIGIYSGRDELLQAIQRGFLTPYIATLFILNITSVISGVALLVLLADYTISRRVLKRHGLELFILLASQAFLWFFTPFPVVLTYLSGFMAQSEALTLIFSLFVTSIPEAILFGYLAYRIHSNKIIFGKNSFLLMFSVFAATFILVINPFHLYSVQMDLLGWVNTWLFEFVYGVAAVFCLSVYMKLRRETDFEVALPLYLRTIIFVYGLVHSGIFSFLVTMDAKYLYFNGGTVASLYFVSFLGLMGVSFLPLRFRTGARWPVPKLV
jgi:hypothetical protein